MGKEKVKVKATQFDKNLNWDYSRELLRAKEDEAYHRKLMEYHQEQIIAIKEVIKSSKIRRMR